MQDVTSLDSRLLAVLGSGATPAEASRHLGITEGYISQLMAKEEFRDEVLSRRFSSMQAFKDRDAKYDSIEDALIAKLEQSIPLLYKPAELLNAVVRINAIKRRGSPEITPAVINQTVVNLQLPTLITDKFVRNSNNQVVSAGEQSLVTIQSGALMDRFKQGVNDDGILKLRAEGSTTTF